MVEKFQDITYRRADPRSDNDIKTFFLLMKQLNDFCLMDTAKPDEEQIKWLRINMGALELLEDYAGKVTSKTPFEDNADKVVFFCEKGEEAIGYIVINLSGNAHSKDFGENLGDIADIYVNPNYRNGYIAYNLLQLGIKCLIDRGIDNATMDVQSYNPNIYLHLALANNNIIDKEEFSLKDGSIACTYTLMFNLKEVKNLSFKQIANKAIQLKKENSDCLKFGEIK